MEHVQHDKTSRVMEAWPLAWVPVGGWRCFLGRATAFFKGVGPPFPRDTHPAPMSPLTSMAHLMNMSLTGVAGCHCQLLDTQPQSPSGLGGLTQGLVVWNAALGKFSCSSTALLGPWGHTRAALPRHLEPFLAPWLWCPKSCCIFQEDAGVPLSRLFSELFQMCTWWLESLGVDGCMSGKFTWSAYSVSVPMLGSEGKEEL